MPDASVPGSAKLGDAYTHDIPRFLSKEEIRDFSRLESGKFTAAATLEFATIAAAIWVSQTWFNPVTYTLAVVVIGSRIHALGALMHDATHYRAYSSRLLNEIVGEVIALPVSISMASYRNTHFAHHRHLNSDDDPDWVKFRDTREYAFPASRGRMAVRILRNLLGLQAVVETIRIHFQKRADRADIPRLLARARLVFFVSLLVASIVFGFWKLLLLYWVVPLVTVLLAIRYLRNVAEHYAVENEHVLNETRTMTAPLWQLWLIAPWGINYHVEHHLYPGVSCFRLGELHRLLMTRDPYPRMAHVTHGYFGGLLRECAAARPAAPAWGTSALAVLQAQARKKSMRLWAEHSPFALKDALKRRGYRWSDGSDGRPRSWYVDVEEGKLQEDAQGRDLSPGRRTRLPNSDSLRPFFGARIRRDAGDAPRLRSK